MSDYSGGRGFRGGLRHLPHLTVRAQQLRQFIAVGMPVTRHPLHRSGREALPHPASPSGLTAHGPWATEGGPTTTWPYTRQRLGHAPPALPPVRVTGRLVPVGTARPSTRS